jgi:hypothetical protein
VSVAPGSTCTFELTMLGNLNAADNYGEQVIDVPTGYAEATITWADVASNSFANQQVDLVCLHEVGSD